MNVSERAIVTSIMHFTHPAHTNNRRTSNWNNQRKYLVLIFQLIDGLIGTVILRLTNDSHTLFCATSISRDIKIYVRPFSTRTQIKYKYIIHTCILAVTLASDERLIVFNDNTHITHHGTYFCYHLISMCVFLVSLRVCKRLYSLLLSVMMIPWKL